MTNEALRQSIVSGIDSALATWLFRVRLSAEQLRLLKAQRDFWLNAPDASLADLNARYERQPVEAQDRGRLTRDDVETLLTLVEKLDNVEGK